MKTDFLRRMVPSAVVFVVLIVATCSFVTTSTLSAQTKKQTGKTLAFKGTVYSSIDGRTLIRMISSDELEITTEGTNLVCKYTKQDDMVRAVVNNFGTTQAVYYRITAEGLQDKEGRIFYSPTRLETARQQAEAAMWAAPWADWFAWSTLALR